MGSDIHWIIERQHQDGQWETVLSKIALRQAFFKKPPFSGRQNKTHQIIQSPGYCFGLSNHHFAAALSCMRHPEDTPDCSIPHSGLPNDLSTHLKISFLSNSDFHSYKHFTLGDLHSIIDNIDPLHNNDPEYNTTTRRRAYLSILKDMIGDETKLQTIYYGKSYNSDTEEFFPEMLKASNHHILNMKERSKGLLAIDNQTVRMITYYSK